MRARVNSEPSGPPGGAAAAYIDLVAPVVHSLLWQTGGDAMSKIYDALADDYDWLFDDDLLKRGAAITQPATARLLSQLDPSCRLLDAACGTGIDTAVLVRRGFQVWAADGSPVMVRRAQERFAQEGISVSAFRATWAELAAATDARFDAVFCIGNSLVHAAGPEAMVAALLGLRSVLRPDGVVVVDSRNWEKLHRERRRVQVANRVVVRGERRCIVVYFWEIPQAFEDEHVAHLVFIFDDGNVVESREHQIEFSPFTIKELRERLQGAGLQELDNDFDPEAERYSIVAIT